MESTTQEDKVHLEEISRLINNRQKDPSVENFWRSFHGLAREDTSESSLQDSMDLFSNGVEAFGNAYHKFTLLMHDIPFSAALGWWIQEISKNQKKNQKYILIMTQLLEKKVIPFFSAEGKVITLEGVSFLHQYIVENIRCVPEWSFLEKEEKVQCYIDFSHDLAERTKNYVSCATDPDRDKVSHRLVKYESFIEFITYLSDRDALIAKLIYFGAPSIDEVLNLKCSALRAAQSEVRFEKKLIRYPRHVIVELDQHIKDKTDASELVFTNVRNARVERSHLNQSFTRASERMKNQAKITPGSLLKNED